MATFKFSLEPVLRYKESLVDLFQMELATLEQRARQARAVRDALKTQIEHSNAELRDRLDQGRLDVDEVNRYRIYAADLSRRLDRQQAIVADLEAQVASKREELLEVRQDQEMLEELKQRQLERFQEEVHQAEAQLIDESAIVAFNRSHMMQPRKPAGMMKGENTDVG